MAGGTHIESDPFIIETPAELQGMRSTQGYYRLGNDIDMTFDTQDPSGAYYNSGSGWSPHNAFSGTWHLDGAGFKIIGLKVNRSSGDGFGLAARCRYNIKDLICQDFDISGTDNVSCFGHFQSGVYGVERVRVIGGTFSGTGNVSPLGRYQNSSTNYCRDSSATGCTVASTTGSSAGFATKGGGAVFTRNFCSAAVTTVSGTAYGFADTHNGVSNSYWDTDVGPATSGTGGGAVGRTTAQLQTLANYTNYNMVAPASYAEVTGTATAGTDTTLTDSGASFGTLTGQLIRITGGTGAGQSRYIASNTATEITVGTAWTVNPDLTSVYIVNQVWTIDDTVDLPRLYFEVAIGPAGTVTIDGSPVEGAVVIYMQFDDVQLTNPVYLGRSVTNASGEHSFDGEYDDEKLVGWFVHNAEWDAGESVWVYKGARFKLADFNLPTVAPV